MEKLVTVREVAELAGVSLMCASLALRERAGVAPETARKVREAAKKLGYKPNNRRGRNASFQGAELFHIPTEKDVALARYFCRKWEGKGIDSEELYSEAMIALMRAAATFDPTKLCLFGTHLMWCVRSRLRVVFGYPQEKMHRYGVFFVEGDAPLSGDESDATLFDSIPSSEEYRFKEELDELLSFVSPDESYLLTEWYIEGKSAVHLAAEIGRTPEEVTEFVESALFKIREAVGVSYSLN